MGRTLHSATRICVLGFLALYALLWLFVFSNSWTSYRGAFHKINFIGMVFGIVGYVLFSISFFFATRWRRLEDWIGGLDRIYHYHHQIGLIGFILILIHPFIIALKWLPQRIDKFFLFFFPVHGRESVNLGSWAYWLMIVIIGITLLKLLRYDKWKLVHKCMSIVFLLASLHILLSDHRLSTSSLAQVLILIPMALGFIAMIYKQLIMPIKKLPVLEVTKTNHLNENVVEITFAAKEKAFIFVPGQYVFIKFEGPHLTHESHPFTLIGSSGAKEVSILAKARGDFTKRLYSNIQRGYLARFEGPYGRFDYSAAGNDQVWIGAGIGIVPFLSWVRNFRKTADIKRKVDLFYCVHRNEDAVFAKEFQSIAKLYPGFHMHFFCSEEHRRITAQKVVELVENLQEKKILMCGPKRLTKDLCSQFQSIGIKTKNILFEDFEFF